MNAMLITSGTMQTASKILVVGINPANKSKSQTLKRLNRWMDELNIKHYSFMNCIFTKGVYSADQVDYSLISQYLMGIKYYKILALGGFSSNVLDKIKIDHFKLPHPSPRNRKLNDKTFETNILKECKKYIHD